MDLFVHIWKAGSVEVTKWAIFLCQSICKLSSHINLKTLDGIKDNKS